MAPKKRHAIGGFIEHEVSEKTFQGMDHEAREMVLRYGIPLPAEKGWRRFKMTRQWFTLAFPEVDIEDK